MIDIHKKKVQYREATATGKIRLTTKTMERIKAGKIEKGDPIQIAILAGIQGAKLTPTVIPLCHPLPLERTDVKLEFNKSGLKATATVVATSKTGVEMEALVAVTTALLNIWDVLKMYEKDKDGQYPFTEISNIRVIRKIKQ
ncbi:MAG: cyclic pyranopterin monophosphate synthase MoaC [Candidatus Poseidoniia archaeon]|jgi:cyclic pyranopterin phosphate synthase|nr:cyclic pyranopterin monophosphate synthase MoaC [Candidatus Poseidoniia archaeon]|tara:strand:- start:222 stop:647 length:426 start_codon:yes stop_codon:yes gene_type:complete